MSENILELEKKLFIPVYKRIPIDISHATGVHIISKEGKKYLDFFGGLAVNSLGHAHPAIITAIKNQLTRFSHISNYFITDVQIEFADLLLKYSKMDKVFLTNSGTEATEAVIKLIRKLFGPEKKIFSLSGNFHGRTYGGISLSSNQKKKKLFSPLLPGIEQIVFNDIDDLKEKINLETAAVFVEFIQGEGGINILSGNFVNELLKLRDEFNFLIVSDSIQCGIGRTGKAFSHNYYKLEPDIILAAKSIGGGLPLGAMLVKQKLGDVFSYGEHGSTFGGNPVSCAAGTTLLKKVFETDLIEHVFERGYYLMDQLNEIKNLLPYKIKEVRGRGLMIGIEMFDDAEYLLKKMMDRQVLINITQKNIVRLLPPFIIAKEDADFFLFNFHECLKET